MEEVYRHTFDAVRTAAGRILAEPAERDAIVQQTYVELLDSRKLRLSFQGENLGAWLAAIARHKALDFARRESRLTDLSALDDEDAPGTSMTEFRRDLADFARRLEGVEREIVRLRYVEGMTQAEASLALGMARSTLEDREQRLKGLLRVYMLGPEPVQGGTPP